MSDKMRQIIFTAQQEVAEEVKKLPDNESNGKWVDYIMTRLVEAALMTTMIEDKE